MCTYLTEYFFFSSHLKHLRRKELERKTWIQEDIKYWEDTWLNIFYDRSNPNMVCYYRMVPLKQLSISKLKLLQNVMWLRRPKALTFVFVQMNSSFMFKIECKKNIISFNYTTFNFPSVNVRRRLWVEKIKSLLIYRTPLSSLKIVLLKRKDNFDFSLTITMAYFNYRKLRRPCNNNNYDNSVEKKCWKIKNIFVSINFLRIFSLLIKIFVIVLSTSNQNTCQKNSIGQRL